MKKQNIEVEGGELLIQSKEGHYAVIPAKHRLEIIDMVKDGCDDCINNYIQALPKDSDYAEDGSLLPDWDKIKATLNPKNKKIITFEPKPYTVVQDNTYVAPPRVVIPSKLEREQPVLKADTRTDQERKIAQEYTESVLNPSIMTQIGEGFQKPLRWLADPVKAVGDIVSALAPNSLLAKDLPNTNEDVFEYRKKQLDPYTSNKEKINNTINEAAPLTSWALLNTLPAEAAVGNTIKSGKNLIKPMSKVVSKTDDAIKVGSKVLNKTDDVVKPIVSSVDDVSKQVTKPAWVMEELPGLHLKSTIEGEAISKIVEPKTGLVNVEQALGIIGKESGGTDKVALIKQGLGETLPKKMDYNEFRKVVQDQLIPLERQFSTHASNYGINRIGYLPAKKASYDKSISYTKELIAKGEDVAENTAQLNKLLKEYEQLPLENQTLILGNKGKFGRGSSAHGNPEETLGHIHFLRDAETPDVLTVTQIQSDAFQGTHRIMPKVFNEAAERQSLKFLEEQAINQEKLYKQAIKQKDGSWLYPDGTKVSDKIHNEFSSETYNDLIAQKQAEIKNFTQKQLLDKNHQERYLQELVDYAGKRGDVNKVRVPTSETAAKVQGYDAKKTWNIGSLNNGDNVILSDGTKGTVVDDTFNNFITIKTENGKELNIDFSDAGYGVSKQSPIKSVNNVDVKEIGEYTSEHQTILKKYSEQPKTIKKLFGVEPKIVTDSKGNTWYEFDIPKKFKEGKGEIKAFTVVPAAIGTGVAIQSQNQNKTK